MSTEGELAALFRAEQAVTPAAHAVGLGWHRLAADLASNAAPLPVSTGALKLAAWLVPKWVLLGFAVGLAGTSASAALFGAGAPKQARASHRPNAVLRTSTQQAPAASEAVVASVVPMASALGHVARVAPLAVVASSQAPEATFDAELELISLAKAELDAHNPRQAQAWLAEHARRFPNGVSTVEREALVAIAGCQQRPNNDAAVRAFAERHPGSPLIARLERACRVSADFANSVNGSGGGRGTND